MYTTFLYVYVYTIYTILNWLQMIHPLLVFVIYIYIFTDFSYAPKLLQIALLSTPYKDLKTTDQ